MASHSIIRIGINLLLLWLLLLPVHILIGGRMYPDGILNNVDTALFMYGILLVLIVLYAENIRWGFYFASMIVMANFFSIIPTWVYTVEGVLRIEDLAMLITVAVLFFKKPERSVRPEIFPAFILVIAGFVAFQYMYSVIIIGESPWASLREIRPYLHYLWFFFPFFIFTRSDEITHYLVFLLIGTMVNALIYVWQVVYHIDLGYIISRPFMTLAGGIGWRVWQGMPDLLLPALVFFFIRIFVGSRYTFGYITGLMVLLICLFLTGNRTFMIAFPLAIIGGMYLYARPSPAQIFRSVTFIIIGGMVFMGSIALASKLMGVDNIFFARFDQTHRTVTDMIIHDPNLLGRLSLLVSVISTVNETNPLLGLGFIGVETELAHKAGIEYLGTYLIRTRDAGMAAIIGQGGWVFFGLTLSFLVWVSVILYRIARSRLHPVLNLLPIALISFIAGQTLLSITTFGLTSTQVTSTIGIGLACTELLYRFESERSR